MVNGLTSKQMMMLAVVARDAVKKHGYLYIGIPFFGVSCGVLEVLMLQLIVTLIYQNADLPEIAGYGRRAAIPRTRPNAYNAQNHRRVKRPSSVVTFACQTAP